MNRRSFTKNVALGSLATILPFGACSMPTTTKYKIGYQLFSIRDRMAINPTATLEALKKMGYQDFEHFGFDAAQHTFYGMQPSVFKSVLSDLGLTISSGHYPFAPLLNEDDKKLLSFVNSCIDGALTIHSKYIIWPWIAPEQRTLENYKKLSDRLNFIGKKVTDAGLGFAYHNHGYEFDDLEGQTGYEIIVERTDPQFVKLQMDMYWVMHAGRHTPRELVDKHSGRYVSWHIKDMHNTSRDYTELGNGSIDYKKILPDPSIAGLRHLYIEQGGNYTVNSLESAQTSISYYKKYLQHLL